MSQNKKKKADLRTFRKFFATVLTYNERKEGE